MPCIEGDTYANMQNKNTHAKLHLFQNSAYDFISVKIILGQLTLWNLMYLLV